MKRRKIKGWVERSSPNHLKAGGGWFRELNEVFVDEKRMYCVMIRPVETEWGTVEHACIRNTPCTDIPWAEKQRIKNEIFGKERIAVEVFPEESKLVDEANLYHIWVLPEGFKMPFGLK